METVRGYPAPGMRVTRRQAVNPYERRLYDYCKKQRTELAEQMALLDNGTRKSNIRTPVSTKGNSHYKIADIRHQLAFLDCVISRLEAGQPLD